ncbi:hypothetical protein [Pseudonocardia sp. N23]|uniref:hypothetical protein n=1 Tax=Pseudonocardia sp. N23 TaxID=1987376 RepID=UPI000BFC9FFF|nr:hypothetical protein [Pseudonocardia sp. N23]
MSVRIELLPVAADTPQEPRREVVQAGSQVEIVAPTGMVGQLHVQGFEIFSTTTTQRELRFRADDPGTYVVEADETGQQLVVLEVLPVSSD